MVEYNLHHNYYKNRPSIEMAKGHCFFWDEERQRSFFCKVNGRLCSMSGEEKKWFQPRAAFKGNWTDTVLGEVLLVLNSKKAQLVASLCGKFHFCFIAVTIFNAQYCGLSICELIRGLRNTVRIQASALSCTPIIVLLSRLCMQLILGKIMQTH